MASESDFTTLHETNNTVAVNTPPTVRILQALLGVWRAAQITSDYLHGITFGRTIGTRNDWKLETSGTALILYENTGLDGSPTWTARNVFSANTGLNLNADRISGGVLADARISQSSVTQHEAAIDHDNLLNSGGNRHIDHSLLTLTAGTDLLGGGTLDANRTINHDVSGIAGTEVAVGNGWVLAYNARGHLTDKNRYRSRTKKTTAQTSITTEADVTDLTALAFPDTPDGAKTFLVKVRFNGTYQSNNDGTVTFRCYVGATGAMADGASAVEYRTSQFWTDTGRPVEAYSEFEVTPAASEQIGLSIESGQNFDAGNGATVGSQCELTVERIS